MQYGFILTSKRPCLFHADDVMASDRLKEWQKDPKNKEVSVKGDDRSPAWTWQLYLYGDDDGFVTMPQTNIMACLRKAAARIPLPNGRGGKTFKELSQSGLLIEDEFCRFTTKGKQISLATLSQMADKPFKEQFDSVKDLGFELMVKRAKPPGSQSKHVRVRPMFKSWHVHGTITVTEPIIKADVLKQMFDIGGRYVGLLDWRPGSPQSPGPYGMYTCELTPLAS